MAKLLDAKQAGFAAPPAGCQPSEAEEAGDGELCGFPMLSILNSADPQAAYVVQVQDMLPSSQCFSAAGRASRMGKRRTRLDPVPLPNITSTSAESFTID